MDQNSSFILYIIRLCPSSSIIHYHHTVSGTKLEFQVESSSLDSQKYPYWTVLVNSGLANPRVLVATCRSTFRVRVSIASLI